MRAKGLQMFDKVGIPIVGIVENMSTHVCSNCGHTEPILAKAAVARCAATTTCHSLGGLPLDSKIRAQSDGGRPTVVADPDGTACRPGEIARKVAIFVAQKSEDHTAKFPTIKVVS